VKVGDLIQYRHDKPRSQIGLVVEIDNKRENHGAGGDRYLIQWSNGRRWFVAKDWVEVVQ
jgi:hypothetical protein